MKDLTIKQWSAKVEALNKKSGLSNSYVTADISYRHSDHSEPFIIYACYFSATGMASAEHIDWATCLKIAKAQIDLFKAKNNIK